MTYAGVELGGTKCVLLLAEGKTEIIDRAVYPTGSPDETLSNIQTILLRWQQTHELEGIGIASFGPLNLDPTSGAFGTISAPQKRGWDRVDLLARLKNLLSAPIALDTDVNGAALAEMRWGAGLGLADFAYVTVGTGVGVGLIVAGHPIRGFGHCELGHIRIARLPGDGWPGSCPLHGDCVEGLASGSMLHARFGDDVSTLEADDPVWDGVVWALGQLCHTIACATAPRRIVIGGGVLVAQPHLLPRIDQKVRESLNGFLSLPDDGPYVTAPGLGPDAGPFGAIALAMTAKR